VSASHDSRNNSCVSALGSCLRRFCGWPQPRAQSSSTQTLVSIRRSTKLYFHRFCIPWTGRADMTDHLTPSLNQTGASSPDPEQTSELGSSSSSLAPSKASFAFSAKLRQRGAQVVTAIRSLTNSCGFSLLGRGHHVNRTDLVSQLLSSPWLLILDPQEGIGLSRLSRRAYTKCQTPCFALLWNPP